MVVLERIRGYFSRIVKTLAYYGTVRMGASGIASFKGVFEPTIVRFTNMELQKAKITRSRIDEILD